MNKTKVLLFAMLLSLVLACSLTTVPFGGSTPDVGTVPTDEPTSTLETIPTSEPTSAPSTPVGIQAGLASLDSYSLVADSTFTGPTQADYSNTHFEINKSNDPDATYTHYTFDESSADSSEPMHTESYSYTIGDATCSGSEADGWEYTESTPQKTEMENLLVGMMDFLPIIEDPTFVGSETMNGIETNHFTFQISGLGLESGAEVTNNQGEYWLAQDGQYIVKYTLVTETVDPTANTTMHMDVSINLTGINLPVEISLPAGCIQ